ncbi:hypothetical protein [Streptomyces anulatus]|uniref:hypothetical protein n=1 Tax=Streptomyces anulatus TaxID=1892 RepID=UPI003669468F
MPQTCDGCQRATRASAAPDEGRGLRTGGGDLLATLLKRLRSGSKKNATYARLPRDPNRRIQPGAYDPKLDVDFTPLRNQDLAAAGFGQVG